MSVSVIIAAGGQGTRLGAGVPKQWLAIGGRSLLERSIAAFDAHPRVTELVIVVPPGMTDAPVPATATPCRIVTGGARRQDSVAEGFAAVSAHGFDRMPPVSFTKSEAEDLVAYFDSLH